MPISLVNQNMERAQKRNAIKESQFYFPKTILRGKFFSLSLEIKQRLFSLIIRY